MNKSFEEMWKIIEYEHDPIDIKLLDIIESEEKLPIDQQTQKKTSNPPKNNQIEISDINILPDIKTIQKELSSCKSIGDFVSKLYLLVYFKNLQYIKTDKEHQFKVKIENNLEIVGKQSLESEKLAKRLCGEALFEHIITKYQYLQPLKEKFEKLIK